MRIFLFLLSAGMIACSPSPQQKADLILFNGVIATMDDDQPQVEAVAIGQSRILAVGSDHDIMDWQGEATEMIDLEGKFAMPGFIEGHGHFSGMGSSLQNLDFLRSTSWDDIVEAVGEAAAKSMPGEWIIGRGWHQEKWVRVPEEHVHGYPFHHDLSAVSPDNPVLLVHASGHGSLANKAAMEAAGISRETPDPFGGEIVRDVRGDAIGIFEERAQELLQRAYQQYLSTQSEEDRLRIWFEGIDLAQQECFRNGITSFQDAGSSFEWIDRFRQLAEAESLKIRLWVMIRHPFRDLKGRLGPFPWVNIGDGRLTVRAIKSEVDGALGAFGAWLVDDYADKMNFKGQNTTAVEEVDSIAALAIRHGLQLCVHAIGDRANHEVLNLFEKHFRLGSDTVRNDLRWRIEHAQHLLVDDIPRFAQLGVIAVMQGIHCTSDAPFVERRLGYERARTGAYPWRSLLDAGAVIANGTDVPVELVDPFESLYASVTRRRSDSGLEFFPEQAMTRQEALRSYTVAAAYAAFEEDTKGSLVPGKYGDIVVLTENLLTCSDERILATEVLYTLVGGEIVYQK